MKKNQHVVPSGDQWAVRGEGNSKKTRITQTQKEAIPYDKSASSAMNAGRSIAQIDCPARDALKEIYDKVRELLF